MYMLQPRVSIFAGFSLVLVGQIPGLPDLGHPINRQLWKIILPVQKTVLDPPTFFSTEFSLCKKKSGGPHHPGGRLVHVHAWPLELCSYATWVIM